MTFRPVLCALLLAGGIATMVAAQDAPPKRPKLAQGADSNDAQEYLVLARRELDSDPGVAFRAFYWASRLQPDLATAFYGRAVAAMLEDHDLLDIHFNGGGNEKERKADKALDSLYALAFSLDPFLHRAWDKTLLVTFAEMRVHGDGSSAALRAAEDSIATWGTSWKAWLFYSSGRFREALDFYALASRRAPKNDTYLARRGEIHLRLLEMDSAVKYLKEAIVAAGA
ncbi:MAG: hypothetical protein HY275_09725, partial [Gemmatimonadetes bacterium]|nr:hypothetical protein [Gemmatimonadota bacterium]